jgi:hypothetical protein
MLLVRGVHIFGPTLFIRGFLVEHAFVFLFLTCAPSIDCMYGATGRPPESRKLTSAGHLRPQGRSNFGDADLLERTVWNERRPPGWLCAGPSPHRRLLESFETGFSISTMRCDGR